MSVVKEIIKLENNNLCFGNYLLEEKNKVDNFVFEEVSFLSFSILRITKSAFLSSGLCSKNL